MGSSFESLRKFRLFSCDGGGIRIKMVAHAITALEQVLGVRTLKEVFQGFAGTSAGAIMAAALAYGFTGKEINELCERLAGYVFQRQNFWRISDLFGPKYEIGRLEEVLYDVFGDKTMGELWSGDSPEDFGRNGNIDLVVTSFNMREQRPVFMKPWKKEQYADLPIVEALLRSSAAPTKFEPFHNRYIDGGITMFNNPCYIAAVEAVRWARLPESEVSLVSFGTGRRRMALRGKPLRKWNVLDWTKWLLDNSFAEKSGFQVEQVNMLYPGIDFRRYQQVFDEEIELDDISKIKEIDAYGKKLAEDVFADRREGLSVPLIQ